MNRNLHAFILKLYKNDLLVQDKSLSATQHKFYQECSGKCMN